jgi:hypothetical protein
MIIMLFAAVLAAIDKDENGILLLDTENWSEALKTYPMMLVYFYKGGEECKACESIDELFADAK